MTTMPKDSDAHPIPTLSYKPTGAKNLSFDGSTKRVALPTDVDVVTMTVTEDCYFEFGDENVEADNTKHFWPKGKSEDISIKSGNTLYTHVAAIKGGANDGIMFLSGRV